MITIKKKHNIKDLIFDELLKRYNNVVRYSYNRITKDNINTNALFVLDTN